MVVVGWPFCCPKWNTIGIVVCPICIEPLKSPCGACAYNPTAVPYKKHPNIIFFMAKRF